MYKHSYPPRENKYSVMCFSVSTRDRRHRWGMRDKYYATTVSRLWIGEFLLIKERFCDNVEFPPRREIVKYNNYNGCVKEIWWMLIFLKVLKEELTA